MGSSRGARGRPVAGREAIIIGSGPNGLSAGIKLAHSGWAVTIYEKKDMVGGGMRTAALTLPGYRHDVCSAIHPLAVSSPAFSRLPLADYGLEWIHPHLPLAHPFDDGTAAVLSRSLDETGDSLGTDSQAWRKLMRPVVERWGEVVSDVIGPLRFPRHVLSAVRFAAGGLRSASGLAMSRFGGVRARALFAGLAAHAMMPLERPPTAAFGLVLGAAAHAVGWPFPRAGSQSLADALAEHFRSLGGRIHTNHEIVDVEELPAATSILFDLTPRQVVRIAGRHIPDSYRRALERYRYGCGIFKIDWALREPVPWKAKDCRLAGTIHLGGTMGEISLSEQDAWAGKLSKRPFVLLAQPSIFDPSRAPAGGHTLWAYCHVPNGSDADMAGAIEDQIERFAPGFKDIVVARHTLTASEMEAYNPNFVGGDINGGVQDLGQLFTRPVVRLNPYAMPADGLFICSASTPPGGGVHGLCGYYAAKAVMRSKRPFSARTD